MTTSKFGSGGNRRDHPLWKNDDVVFELARVTAILLSFERRRGNPIKDLVERVTDHAQRSGHALPNDGDYYDELYRLVSFSNITDKSRVLDAIADYVISELGARVRKPGRSKYLSQVFSRFDLPLAFKHYKTNTLKNPVSTNYSRSTIAEKLEFPKVFPDQFMDASRYLTGVRVTRDDERSGHLGYYACYRYSVVPATIAKSQFTIQPCCDGDPVCRFENIFRDRTGAWRNSTGIAFTSGEWLYLVGQLIREHAVKVLAIRATGQTAQIMPGLLMSKSLSPLIARTVLRRLDGPLPNEEIRIEDERTHPEYNTVEFQRDLLPYIRNRMEFQLQQDLVFRHENGTLEEFTQARMVQFLPGLIRGQFFLRDKGGKLTAFNPALHDQYPFNQAISIREAPGQ